MVGGELYPTGPVVLPCRVSIAGRVYTASEVPAMTIAYYASTGRWGLLAENLFAAHQHEISDRAKDPDDALDTTDVVHAAMILAVRLSGLGDGILGWRAMMHMCGCLVERWREFSGRLIDMGVDPTSDPMWRVMAGVYHLVMVNATEEERAWLVDTIEFPLPLEPARLVGAGTKKTVQKRAAASFEALKRGLGG